MLTGTCHDYSVCTTWHIAKGDAYLAHVYRDRLEYPDLRRKVIGMATEHGATTC
jgi:phage terminase large subunit-like protein